MEASKQSLQMDLEESNDRICHLEDCLEKAEEEKAELANHIHFLQEV